MKRQVIEFFKLLREKWLTDKARRKIKVEGSGGSSIIKIISTLNDAEPLADSIVEKRIREKFDKILSDDLIEEALNEANLREYIKTLLRSKIKYQVERQAFSIVSEALEDLDEDYDITNAIRQGTIKRIKAAV